MGLLGRSNASVLHTSLVCPSYLYLDMLSQKLLHFRSDSLMLSHQNMPATLQFQISRTCDVLGSMLAMTEGYQ